METLESLREKRKFAQETWKEKSLLEEKIANVVPSILHLSDSSMPISVPGLVSVGQGTQTQDLLREDHLKT